METATNATLAIAGWLQGNVGGRRPPHEHPMNRWRKTFFGQQLRPSLKKVRLGNMCEPLENPSSRELTGAI